MANIKLNQNLAYDLSAIVNFIFDEGGRDNSVEITETQVADDGGKLVTETKVTHELKSTDSNKYTIKYDMIKMFMDVMNNVEIDQDMMPLSFGETMILNTMLSEGLVKQVNTEEE